MQTQLQRPRPSQANDRQSPTLHARPNSASHTQPPQIARQSIRQIHHRRSQRLLTQPPPQLHPRLRIKMLPQPRIIQPLPRPQQPQPQLRLPQPPAHKYNVPRPRPRPPYRPPCQNVSYRGHINQHLAPLGRVPPSQHTPKSGSRPPQSPQKLPQPCPASQFLRQRQTQQKAPRHPTHRRHIAHRPRQAFPPHRVRGMLVPQKMRPLQKPVASQNNLPPARRPHQRRIIPHPQRNKLSTTHFPQATCTTPFESPPDPLQNHIFATLFTRCQSPSPHSPNSAPTTLFAPLPVQ